MEKYLPLALMVAALAALALAAFGYYRWRQHQRGLDVKAWVEGYLRDRFGSSPERVTVNCSDDRLWPVLVGFDDARTGMRHRLRFNCQGPASSMRLLSEESEERR